MNKLLKLLVATSCFVCQSFAMQNQIVPRWDEAHWRDNYCEFVIDDKEVKEIREKLTGNEYSEVHVIKCRKEKYFFFRETAPENYISDINKALKSKSYSFSNLFYDYEKNFGIICAKGEQGRFVVFKSCDCSAILYLLGLIGGQNHLNALNMLLCKNNMMHEQIMNNKKAQEDDRKHRVEFVKTAIERFTPRKEIAKTLGVSRKTLFKIMKK